MEAQPMTDKPLFDAVRIIKGSALLQTDVDLLNSALRKIRGVATDPLTLRVAMETIEHEAVVLEAYKDSESIWTWSVGLTKASGIDPLLYLDKPASMALCLAAYVDRLRTKYVPDVLDAFDGHTLTEAQFAAAVSFHWNTGAIKSAEWVKSYKRGNVGKAEQEIMNWRSPASIIPRRVAERELFFSGTWKQTGTAMVVPVRKPSYQPNFAKSYRVDITADLVRALA